MVDHLRYKKRRGPHLISTRAETLEEAVDVIAEFQRRDKIRARATGRKASFKALFALARGAARFKDITLSDRVVKHPKVRAKELEPARREAPAWSKERVVEAYASGFFKPAELAQLARRNVTQVKSWIWGPEWAPDLWRCCSKSVTEPSCPKCGTHWRTKFGVEPPVKD